MTSGVTLGVGVLVNVVVVEGVAVFVSVPD